MENLLITEKMNDTFVLLTVAGSINSYTYHEFETKVYSLIKSHSIVLDVSRVINLSSSGLGLNPSEVVKLAIASTGFTEVFPIIHSLDEVK